MIALTHSKSFVFPKGHVNFKATTAGDLIKFLGQFPDSMPVLTTWEGTVHSLASPEVTAHDGCEVLVFDVENDER